MDIRLVVTAADLGVFVSNLETGGGWYPDSFVVSTQWALVEAGSSCE